jgi:nitrogen-specific signal transduction histidine kinase
MNLYSRKQTWKIGLGVAAIIIIVASLFYTNYLIREVATEERQKIKLWVDAIQKKADLVNYTNNLFNKVKAEERKRIEIWAEASRMLTISESSADLNFYLKILNNNTTIPVILTDQKGEILSWKNVDEIENGIFSNISNQQKEILKENLKAMRARRDSIIIPLQGNNYNCIYYNDSKIFFELKGILEGQLKNFITEIVDNTASVPVIVTGSDHQTLIASGNIDDNVVNTKTEYKKLLREMKQQNKPITVTISNNDKNFIYYKDSNLLTTLKYFPFIQLGVIALFLVVGYSLFSTARKSEQNQVWVGMARETAHQLGTPLSSLMAWNELRKVSKKEPDFDEIEKDIKRLETITNRFSKIGSQPILKNENLSDLLLDISSYMQSRISEKVIIHKEIPHSIVLPMNYTLMEWVVENLIRNAVDAMEGEGSINISLNDENGKITLDISDTGKGIPKREFKTVFRPGFTTKKRGWGLGLSLAKRIIEEYHAGKIFVKNSEHGKGTTFRIILPQ